MFKIKTFLMDNYTLKFLYSDTLDDTKLVHLFSTRTGGDTPEPLDTFTISAKDFPEYDDFALKNRKIICKIVKSDYTSPVMPNQQHTDKILTIKREKDIKKLKEEPFDAIITNLKNIPFCLVFADCVPVLLYDRVQNVVACIHAGWKGTAMGICTKAVNLMIKEFNSKATDMQAVIGAAICSKCFEINKDVADKLAMSVQQDYGIIFSGENNKFHADLKNLNKYQLKEAGIKNIDVCEECTSCNNDLFYSYRADNGCTGRHGMIVMLKE